MEKERVPSAIAEYPAVSPWHRPDADEEADPVRQPLKAKEEPAHKTFDELIRQQLLIYASELGEQRRKEKGLVDGLSRREQKILELTKASIRIQEEERQWIAYEVHDRIAQTLASVFHLLQTLESMTLPDPQARQVTVRASILLREAIRESRNIMNDLHPPILDEFGLVPLIEEELRRFQQDRECQVGLDADCQVRPPQEVEIVLYRIFHEALINVGRHARSARNVTVSLACKDHVVSLQVQDDGPGFDVEAATQSKRVGGLMSMQRRAEIAGGALEVTSSSRQGTRVSVSVPLNGDTRKGVA